MALEQAVVKKRKYEPQWFIIAKFDIIGNSNMFVVALLVAMPTSFFLAPQTGPD